MSSLKKKSVIAQNTFENVTSHLITPNLKSLGKNLSSQRKRIGETNLGQFYRLLDSKHLENLLRQSAEIENRNQEFASGEYFKIGSRTSQPFSTSREDTSNHGLS
jgi:hypothetical protein